MFSTSLANRLRVVSTSCCCHPLTGEISQQQLRSLGITGHSTKQYHRVFKVSPSAFLKLSSPCKVEKLYCILIFSRLVFKEDNLAVKTVFANGDF